VKASSESGRVKKGDINARFSMKHPMDAQRIYFSTPISLLLEDKGLNFVE